MKSQAEELLLIMELCRTYTRNDETLGKEPKEQFEKILEDYCEVAQFLVEHSRVIVWGVMGVAAFGAVGLISVASLMLRTLF